MTTLKLKIIIRFASIQSLLQDLFRFLRFWVVHFTRKSGPESRLLALYLRKIPHTYFNIRLDLICKGLPNQVSRSTWKSHRRCTLYLLWIRHPIPRFFTWLFINMQQSAWSGFVHVLFSWNYIIKYLTL